jgi:hypothetical protein
VDVIEVGEVEDLEVQALRACGFVLADSVLDL